MRNRTPLLSGVLLFGILAIPKPGDADEPKPLRRFNFERMEMGVDFKIALYACDSRVANHAAEAAFVRISELNSKLSDYDAESEVRRLCEKPVGRWLPVSEDLHRVLLHATRLSADTDGAFDVTVGHYTKLWRRARRRKMLPDPAELKSLSAHTGHGLLCVDSTCPRVRLEKAGMRIDLGGIAKGYAVDEALTVLKRAGCERALVDGSGDIGVGLPPPGKTGWRIEVAALRDSAGARPVSIEIARCAVATSGDAFQAVEIAGRKYSHIIDPKTGIPLTKPSSVTVVAPSGIEADSLASAISVLGPKRGVRLAEELRRTEASVVTEGQGRTITNRSSGFARYLSDRE